MRRGLRYGWAFCLAAMVGLLVPTLASAAERRGKAIKPGQFNPQNETVEMFQAIEDGQIGVKIIPKDSTRSQVMIENKTKQPLNVKLPEAFAAVPVLAQIGGVGNVGGNNNRNNGGNQGMGGGMGGMGMMGGGMFNVAPEKVGKLKVPTVCLEHGKAEPRPAIPYEIKPIESFTDKPKVHQLCRMLGTGQIPQRAAQVAAWHLNNDMSWQQLAAKRIEHVNGTSEPYFSPHEIRGGMQIAAMAAKLAEQQEKSSPGETDTAATK